MSKVIYLNIADILISIQFDRQEAAWDFKDQFTNFIVPEGKPEITLNVHYGQLPDLSAWQLVFEAAEAWSLLRWQGKFAIQRMSRSFNTNTYQVTIFDSQFRNGEVFIIDRGNGYPRLNIENYLMEILFVNLLSQGQGVMLHAAVTDDGRVGRVFAGFSGAGKSTLSQLWQNSGHGRVLCDDRVILRQRGDQFIAYGTPWRGTAGIAVRGSTPLKQIFILKQAHETQARPLSPREAVTNLFTRAFPTFWDAQGMTYTLDFLAELSRKVPCYELEFTPDPETIDYVRCL